MPDDCLTAELRHFAMQSHHTSRPEMTGTDVSVSKYVQHRRSWRPAAPGAGLALRRRCADHAPAAAGLREAGRQSNLLWGRTPSSQGVIFGHSVVGLTDPDPITGSAERMIRDRARGPISGNPGAARPSNPLGAVIRQRETTTERAAVGSRMAGRADPSQACLRR